MFKSKLRLEVLDDRINPVGAQPTDPTGLPEPVNPTPPIVVPPVTPPVTPPAPPVNPGEVQPVN